MIRIAALRLLYQAATLAAGVAAWATFAALGVGVGWADGDAVESWTEGEA